MSDENLSEVIDVDQNSDSKHQEGHHDTPSASGGSRRDHGVLSGSSLGRICLSLALVSESDDAGTLYVNTREPRWSLVKEFAELSPRDKTGPEDDPGRTSGASLTMTLRNKANLTSSDSSRGQSSPDLQERNNESASETEEEKGSNRPVRTALKNHKKDKVARLLVAMKKRSGGADAEQRPFKCPHCHWAFKKLCNLQSHLQTHSGLKPHVCDTCGKAYSHQGTLQQHKRLHTGERPYRCPFCARTYIWSSDYRKHIRTHTGEKPYACAACGKDFIRSSDLRKHERNTHADDKPFPCAHCGKTFNKALSLKRHERKHLGERPFACPDCGKAFGLASRMAEHRKTHAGVRPYACSVCAKRFTKSSNLAEHQAIHSGERPHKCEQCGLAFAVASRLVRHRYMHGGAAGAAGGRRLDCGSCGKSFGQAEALQLHQERRCAGRIFVCSQCDKSFQCADNLSRHMSSHGGEETATG
ncbi:uncharacterized protein znf648 [Nelusetta ayraudi]|uniref:uncharacterized protein znf648 n=1 Tax=Nelusetta ayraudi TaxID=303726 RepID=UPI003F70E803